jgi:radical SAM superfamily enzyme YgiQ (UPF0313 family)
MKILLINPSGSNWVEGMPDRTNLAIRLAPIGILSIAAYLLSKGHRVKIYDAQNPPAGLHQTKIIDLIDEFKPDLVGFSAVTSNFLNAYALTETIKSRFPQIKIVFGGVHVSALKESILEKFPLIDYLVCGEGEEATAKLACGYPPETVLSDLDTLPFPAYSLLEGFPKRFDGPLFNYPAAPVASIISSRGCIYQCTYCDRSVYRQSFRFNSAQYLYEQMRYLKKDFGVRHIFFYDDLFTFKRERIVELCCLLKNKPLGMTFNCSAHVNHLDSGLLKLLKSAGCWMVSLGIESGDPEILKRHKTNTDPQGFKAAVDKIHRAGLRAKGLFIMGLPGETESTIQTTTRFIHELKLDDMNMTKFTPFPGSPIYKNIRQEGEFEEKWELMNCLNFVFVPKGIASKARLEYLYKQFIRQFYTSKSWILKFTPLCFSSPDSFHRLILNLPAFLKIKSDFKPTQEGGRFSPGSDRNVPLRVLLVKPHAQLLVPIRLQEGFLHLEPLELEIVAGGLSPQEEVKILDLGLEKKDQFGIFEKTVKNWQPDIIGFTGYSTNLSAIKKLAQIAKNTNPRIITIAGGIHATLLPKDFANSQVDIIVRGEGGTALREIVRRFKAKEPLAFGEAVLSTRDAEFAAKAQQPPPEYPAIEKIPQPRRDLVQRHRYFCVWTSSNTGRLKTLFPQVASLRTSIGCAFSCSFCVIHHLMHRKYLQREPEDVVNELAGLKEEYIYFLDDEMFLNAARCRKIAELLMARGIKKEYVSWTRSDTIVNHPEIFKLWRQAGLSTVYVGLESMDDDKLVEYQKRLPVETNRKAVAILKEIGITLHAAFIVHPNFTEDDFKRLENEILKLCPAELSFTVLSPSPGTAFWQENKDRFICDPYYYYDCMHTILPTRMPLKKFYRRFARLTDLALRANPLRVNRIKVPFRDFLRAIIRGTKYIISLQLIYRDYLPKNSGNSGNSGDTLLNSKQKTN